ncbi:MAG: hypothetical protein ACYC40_02380 [Patescibacteria group bacterium]
MGKGQDNRIEDERQQASIDRVGQLNERRRLAVINNEKEAIKIKEEAKAVNDIKPNAINTATSGALKGAWMNLITSLGFTMFWIDAHIFAGTVMGNGLFCKLGREWVPDLLKQTNPKEAEKMGKKLGFAEGIGVIFLNLGCLMVVLAILMIIGVILVVVTNPISAISHIFGYIWDKTIVLFKS